MNKLSSACVKAMVGLMVGVFAENACAVEKSYNYPDETVLVTVGGRDILMGDVNRYCAMMQMFLVNRRPKIKAEDLTKFRDKNIKPFSDAIMRRRVITAALAASNLVASAELRAAKEQAFARNYGRRGQTFAELSRLASTAGFGKEFTEAIESDILLQVYIDTVVSNEYYASEADLVRTKKNIEAYNKIASATNALNRTKAEEVLALAKAKGADFAALADRFSQDLDKKPGGELGDCDEGDFSEDKDVWRKLKRLRPGAVSDVLETSEGLSIYKVEKVNDPESSNTGAGSLSLSRIFFRQGYVYPEETDEELMEDISREKREACLSKVYADLRKLVKVEYPQQ